MISILTPTIRPDGLVPMMASLKEQTMQDYEWLVEVGTPWRGHDLSAAMNRMLSRARGDVVLIYQDWTRIGKDALEKIAENHRLSPKTAFTYPLGKVDDLNDLGENPRWDWRKDNPCFVNYFQWETDFASAPKQMFDDIGGYDEDFDEGWSWENVNVAHRASKKGYVFRVDPTIMAVAWDHDKFTEHPFRGKKENQELNKLKSLEIERGVL